MSAGQLPGPKSMASTTESPSRDSVTQPGAVVADVPADLPFGFVEEDDVAEAPGRVRDLDLAGPS